MSIRVNASAFDISDLLKKKSCKVFSNPLMRKKGH